MFSMTYNLYNWDSKVEAILHSGYYGPTRWRSYFYTPMDDDICQYIFISLESSCFFIEIVALIRLLTPFFEQQPHYSHYSLLARCRLNCAFFKFFLLNLCVSFLFFGGFFWIVLIKLQSHSFHYVEEASPWKTIFL